MVPNVIPPKELLKKLKKSSANSDIWKRAPLFLSTALFLVMGVSFIFSASKTGNIEIATAPGGEDVSGLRAHQTDFRDAGTLIGKPHIEQNIGAKRSVETGSGYGNCPDDDAQLPFDLFYPGRGQTDNKGIEIIGQEVNPSGGKPSDTVWQIDTSNCPGVSGANVASIQKINKNMLDLVFPTKNNDGYNGVVFGDDVGYDSKWGNGPGIIVARGRYQDGVFTIPPNDPSSIRTFRVNSGDYWSDLSTTLNRVYLDYEIWAYRGCSDMSHWRRNAAGGQYKFANEPLNAPQQYAAKRSYPGGRGLMHDVHLVKRSSNSYSFLVTIVNWGVFEFTPTGTTGSVLNRTWSYKMPTYVTDWHMVPAYTTQGTCPGYPGIAIQNWQFSYDATFQWRWEKPTTWSCQPRDLDNDGVWDNTDTLLISVSPWKSYKDNNDSPQSPPAGIRQDGSKHFDHEDDLHYRLQHLQIGNIHYNGMNGYPATNNDPAVYVAPSEVREINRGTGNVVNTYGPSGDYHDYRDHLPKFWGNIVPVTTNSSFYSDNSKVLANNSNYFEVGGKSGVCDIKLPIETGDHLDLYDYEAIRECTPGTNYKAMNGPMIWPAGLNLKDITYGSYRTPSHYSATLYKLPNGDYFINGGGTAASPGSYDVGGYPAIVSDTEKLQWVGGTDVGYTHMGAGAYQAFGTPRSISNFDNQNIDNLVNLRDGGLASQLTEDPPNNSYVRDFNRIKLSGDNHRDPSNPVPGTNTKIAYALAGEDKTIFKTYNTNDKDDKNPNIAETLINQGKDLSKYQKIWLQALMWGDTGSNLNKFETSDTPILYYWGLDYEDKTAKFNPAKKGQGGTSANPVDGQYSSDAGGGQFYTKKDQNMARYEISATNTGDWPANNVKLVDKITKDSTTDAKTTFYTLGSGSGKNPAPTGYVPNQAYYRVIPKGGGVGAQGTLTVMAKGDKDEWTDPDKNNGCMDRGSCTALGGHVGPGVCQTVDHGCQYTCSGTDYYWGGSCGSSVTGCGHYSGCDGSHEHRENCADTALGCKWCGPCETTNCCAGATWPFNHQFCQYCSDQRWRPCAGNDGKPAPWNDCPQNTCKCYRDNGFKCRTYLGDKCYSERYLCYTPGEHHVVWPTMEVWVDGKLVGTKTVNSTSYQPYTFDYNISESNCIEIKFTNDSYHGQQPFPDCNLFVDKVTLADNVTEIYPPNPPGGALYGNSSIIFPCKSSLPYYLISDANINVNNTEDFIFPDGHSVKIGGTVSFTIPTPFPYLGGTSDKINDGDRLEVIYTTNIVKAGKIKNEAHFEFKNVGNSVPVPFPSEQSNPVSCTGNAPYISTQSGDVYLGGGVHPYYAYGNATFLIQSKTDSLKNFNSTKTGWVQNNYILDPELQLSHATRGVKKKMTDNIAKLDQANKLKDIKSIGSHNIDAWGHGYWYLDVNGLGSLGTNSDGKNYVGVESNESDPLYIGGNMPAGMGAKLIVVKNSDLGISHANVAYSSTENVSNLEDLSSLGVVVLNGNMGVAAHVTKMDGAYFVAGNMNTCKTGAVTDPGQVAQVCDNPLKTSGLWIARSFSLNRTYTGANKEPAELVTYDGRVALNPPPGFTIFNNMLIWREVAP